MSIVQTHPLLRFKCSLVPDREGVPRNSLSFKGKGTLEAKQRVRVKGTLEAEQGMGNAMDDQY